jgi:mono/diheme cytochrome c family protein
VVPGFEVATLAGPHALIDNAALQKGQPLAYELTRARKAITWPGDDFVAGLPVLTLDEVARIEVGKALFEESCAVCHSSGGTGIPGVAPSLAGTTFVNDADDWFVRIALQGLSGPVTVQGQHFDAQMPGHGSDPRFDDAALSNLLSYVRRSWGNGGRWMGEDVVARVRTETAERIAPWTVDELAELDVENALDRFAGRYELTVFPITFKIARAGVGLKISAFAMGTTGLIRVDRTHFRADSADRALGIEFVEDAEGVIASILVEISPGQHVSALRVD